MNLQTAAPVQVATGGQSSSQLDKRILESVLRFVEWLNSYGETSYDFQSFYASELGRSAKALYYRRPLLGTLAVSPMIFSEAFVPAARRIYWKRQRFPIADAHYAMGFAFLAQILEQEQYYKKAVHFLEVLKQTRCTGYQHYCWGYPFNWETMRGTITEGTPLITTVPYVYEAFRQVWEIDKNDEWFRIMNSIALHAVEDYKDIETSSNASTCSYTPDPEKSVKVVNARWHIARYLLHSAGGRFRRDDKFWKAAEIILNFVLEAQKPDGSTPVTKGRRTGSDPLPDHFHTCFTS